MRDSNFQHFIVHSLIAAVTSAVAAGSSTRMSPPIRLVAGSKRTVPRFRSKDPCTVWRTSPRVKLMVVLVGAKFSSISRDGGWARVTAASQEPHCGETLATHSLHIVSNSQPNESPMPARVRVGAAPTWRANILAKVCGRAAKARITRSLNESRFSRLSIRRDIKAGRFARARCRPDRGQGCRRQSSRPR